MTDEFVHLSVDGAIGTITLDSPANRNALSRRLVEELDARLAAVAGDASVRAVVLTHTGATFCAGADLAEASAPTGSRTAPDLLRLLGRIIDTPQPVIARIDGNVRAGGVGMVGACDIAVAGPRSSFALTEVRLGLAAAVISLTVLPRMHDRAAARYLLTGEVFGGAEAVAAGLVTEAVEDVDAAVAALTARLRGCSPQGLAHSKRLVTERIRHRLDAEGDRMVELSARLFASEEGREGMRAFLDRRPPRWSVE